jgi:hypothetical protein
MHGNGSHGLILGLFLSYRKNKTGLNVVFNVSQTTRELAPEVTA